MKAKFLWTGDTRLLSGMKPMTSFLNRGSWSTAHADPSLLEASPKSLDWSSLHLLRQYDLRHRYFLKMSFLTRTLVRTPRTCCRLQTTNTSSRSFHTSCIRTALSESDHSRRKYALRYPLQPQILLVECYVGFRGSSCNFQTECSPDTT